MAKENTNAQKKTAPYSAAPRADAEASDTTDTTSRARSARTAFGQAASATTSATAYTMRRPGRPKKSEQTESGPGTPEDGESLRFEMRLPPGIVADLETMRQQTGNTFAVYIRRAIQRALDEDKKTWTK